MNKATVIAELSKKYPGKTVICLPENNPSEILCEIESTSEHAGYSVALSIIDKSDKHFHQITKEKYTILKGSLTLFKNDKRHILHEGDVIEIFPGEVHWAEGDETWVEVRSSPGWTQNDHLLLKKE